MVFVSASFFMKRRNNFVFICGLLNYMRYLYRMKIPYISPLFVKHFGKSVKMMIAIMNL